MPATFEYSESNTAIETVTDAISNLNFGSIDSPNLVTTTYPITAGLNSFSKYIRVKFSGSFTTISNMLFWMSIGTLVTDETIKAGANVAFATPSQTATGDSGVPTTEGSALAIQASNGSSTIVAPGYTKYIRLQTQTSTSTPSGAVNQKTFTFQYDEV